MKRNSGFRDTAIIMIAMMSLVTGLIGIATGVVACRQSVAPSAIEEVAE